MTAKPAMPTDLERLDPTDRATYRLWIRDILRYNDLDVVGHVNNNAIGCFIEDGRTNLFTLAGEKIDDTVRGRGLTWVVRRLEIDFINEIRFPGDVEIGTRIVRFGNSSMLVRAGIFSADRCCVTATTVSVCFDSVARRAAPIPAHWRDRLHRLSEGEVLPED